MSRYRFVEAEKGRDPVTRLCRRAQVSRAAYYQWQEGRGSVRQAADAALSACPRSRMFSNPAAANARLNEDPKQRPLVGADAVGGIGRAARVAEEREGGMEQVRIVQSKVVLSGNPKEAARNTRQRSHDGPSKVTPKSAGSRIASRIVIEPRARRAAARRGGTNGRVGGRSAASGSGRAAPRDARHLTRVVDPGPGTWSPSEPNSGTVQPYRAWPGTHAP